ncbi:Flp pilus assembly protein CpaB [Cohnella lubricantis]|uniref:Flp pilus assembly protein CpaB n=1 Tax=Cohnella lubricantis TaxID=2163172 RepID=A0A841TKQ6_9BACL|nr:Flp pilus assembly protein CpaB [Cohnella lubricantis]MBB6679527.1 Flp pilus assembly protein CpaB [Cohnella lubricantis]MBP2119253.1 pilus assembly protein CpaB [Cohnella lubricantis]
MRSKIILIAALLMGIVTTVLFFNYMKQYKEAPALKDENYVSVLAAKQDISENTKITSGMLEVISVPESAVHAQALKTPPEAEGKIAAASMAAGEILLANHLKDQKEEAQFVSKKVRDGYRAVSVGVNIVQSVSNLIEPGDYVDVVRSEYDKTDTGKFESEILLENVPVLAIGRRMVEAESDTPYVEYAQVTLELTPTDGVKVINSDEDDDVKLSLMLHSRIDQGQKQKSSQ